MNFSEALDALIDLARDHYDHYESMDYRSESDIEAWNYISEVLDTVLEYRKSIALYRTAKNDMRIAAEVVDEQQYKIFNMLMSY
jgi:hypothetical protein